MQFGIYMMHSPIIVRLRISLPQYSQPAVCPQSFGRPETISSSSAVLTDACSEGSLRNHVCQIATHTNPTVPKLTKIARHDIKVSIHNTSAGVRPPTRCAPAKKTPCTVPRSRIGIQRENVRATHGHAPASPRPNRKRIPRRTGKLTAAPVAAVRHDHHSTMRESTERVPRLSAQLAV